MDIFGSCLTVLIVLLIGIALVIAAVGAILLTYLPYILAGVVAFYLFKKLTDKN